MKHVHFLGICGTAMGAVASAMARKGYVVTGTDANVYPPMSTFLESEGIRIFQGYKPENIPGGAPSASWVSLRMKVYLFVPKYSSTTHCVCQVKSWGFRDS